METVQQLAARTGMKANTIQKALRKFRDTNPDKAAQMGLGPTVKIALSLILSPDLAAVVTTPRKQGRPAAIPKAVTLDPSNGSHNPPSPRPAHVKTSKIGWLGGLWKSANLKNFGVVMIRLSIFSMGTRASWGVFSFSALLDPLPLAIIEACSLELIYIGLTFAPVDDDGKKNVLWVSASALFVSVLYNVLASAHQQSPGIFENLDSWLFWVMAFLHGSPMAILNFVTLFVIFDHIKKMRK